MTRIRQRPLRRICLFPPLSGSGGPATFQAKMSQGLKDLGIEVSYNLADPGDILLVVGGTRHLTGLWRARRRGTPIVQRLDGMNWLHRRLPTGARHYLRAEYGNLILTFIRNRLADRVIYQSRFAQDWWERVRGPAQGSAAVIHNGVDLKVFTPDGPQNRPNDRYRLLIVEGNLAGGYEVGLEHALGLGQRLHTRMDLPVEVQVVGNVPQKIKSRYASQTEVPIHWTGQVSRERIPVLVRSAHLLFSADLHPACPNAVIEALACGLPVIALKTGALPELVTPETGRVVPYGGDPWRLDPPDLDGLAEAAVEILQDQARIRAGARARAEALFGLDKMVRAYLGVLRQTRS